MARAIWSGAISFGLVSIPVRLFSAVSRKNVQFNQLDSRTNSRIRQKRVSAADGEEVLSEHLVKGYELTKGQYVTVTDDELAALDPAASRTIDIQEFVDLAEIDPVFYDKAYILGPDPNLPKPYALLAQAMDDASKVGIASFVMRNKQYLAAIRPRHGHLLMSTMVYADELVDPAEVPGFDELVDVEVSDNELAMAEQLIGSLSEEYVADKHRDHYRESLLDLIEKKASGEEIALAPEPASPERVVDLMAALEASVAEAKEARKRHPTSKPTAEKAKKRTRKAPARKSA
ncbi:MAG: Ku protein [Actinomycetia bacterium]|nr:Ku protein [Actinomycetes bacterium]